MTKAASKQLDQLAAASFEAERRRKRVAERLSALQTHAQRFTPSALANQAWTGVRERGSEIADDAAEAVKARPVVAAGAVAAFFLFLARGRIASAASRLWSRSEAGEEPAD